MRLSSAQLGLLLVIAFSFLTAGCEGGAAYNSARRMNEVRQIGMAMLSYETQHGTFPAAGSVNDQGEPLLSWRVAILPFIEQQALYEQFKQDEPWDSEHNLALLKQMPEIFGDDPGGKTRIQVFDGEEAAFHGGRKVTPRDIAKDGMSLTIMLVETGPDKAVPWTKPADVPFDPTDPAKALGKIPAAGFITAFFDGSVRSHASSIQPEVLKAMITPAGGELIPVE